MQATKEVIKDLLGSMEPKGQTECEKCGTVYMLYKTPRGITGACKNCVENETRKKFNIPTSDQYRKDKKLNFILSFERVTSDLKDVTVNSYIPRHETQETAKKYIADYLFNFDGRNSIVLSGTPGLGKSHLAYAINRAVRKAGFDTLFIKSTDLLDHIRNTYSEQSNISESHIFEMINSLDLLVLDDVGSEYVKGNDQGHESWASDVLYKVFDMRLDKAIVCTTNYTESELIAKYGNNGPRIISRMMDKAIGIRLEGEDYRKGRGRF